jgi:hypothetical protein
MNHVLTLGGLLGIFGLMAGAALSGFGGLMFFAAGMSDAPDESGTANKGCLLALAGVGITVLCLIGLFR